VNSLKAHFRNPADFALTALAFSAPVVWLAAYVFMRGLRSERAFWVALPVALLVAFFTLALRIARGLPHRDGRAETRCALCGESRPNAPVRYLQVTGALVVMWVRELGVFCCPRCSARAFARTTLHTAVFGPWSLLAVFIAPGALFNNVAFLVANLFGATEQAHAHAVLETYRGYARELLETSDEATVVQALSKNTGLSTDRIARFVRELR
jgi:hypothetical protein